MKVCKKCKIQKEEFLFIFNKNTCKKCFHESQINTREINRKKKREALGLPPIEKNQCRVCLAVKTENDFRLKRRECVECEKKYARMNSNKPENKALAKHKRRESYLLNLEKNKKSAMDWKKNNPEKYKIQREKTKIKQKTEAARKKAREYVKSRRMTHPRCKIAEILRKRVYSAVKRGSKKTSAIDLVGCSIDFLLKYLEEKFSDNMNWENHGHVWHIDHIIPCFAFDLTKIDHQMACFHYTNLQPLLKEENHKKTNKILHPELIPDILKKAS